MSGSQGATIGDMVVGNAQNSTQQGSTGHGGWWGGKSGTITKVGNAQNNKVTIAPSNGSPVSGSVGTVQGSIAQSNSGVASMFGRGSGKITNAGNGQGNTISLS